MIKNIDEAINAAPSPRYPHIDPSIPDGIAPSNIPGQKIIYQNGVQYTATINNGYIQGVCPRDVPGVYVGFDVSQDVNGRNYTIAENVKTTQASQGEYSESIVTRTYPNVASGGITIIEEKDIPDSKSLYEYTNFHSTDEYPDHKRYIIATPTSSEFEVMYPNNIVLPIRINNTVQMALGQKAFKDKEGHPTCRGIFIIDHYLMATLPFHLGMIEVAKYLNYFTNSGIVLSEARHIITDIARKYKDRSTMRDAYLRIVTFIPESEFIASSAIFVRHTGLVVGRNLKERSVHPFSIQGGMIAEKTVNRARNYIDISIVDNTNPNAAYYMKVGKKVMELHVERNLEKTEGATVSIDRNSDRIVTMESALDKMSSELGIYRTKEEARYDAESIAIRTQMIEERRLEAQLAHSGNVLEKSKIDNDTLSKKAEIERERYYNDITKLRQENANIHANMQLEELKYKTEVNKYLHAVVKNMMDIGTMDIKYQYELAKAQYDISKLTRSTILEATVFCSKMINLVGTLL